jgi:hypothetical protein
VVAVILVAALACGIVLAALGTGGGGATPAATLAPGAAATSVPDPAATQSAGLACSDFGALDAALQKNDVTPAHLQAALDQVVAEASVAAGQDPGTWAALARDAATLDTDVASASKGTGAAASALARDCSTIRVAPGQT